jgi:hypothetical protein
MSEANSHTDKIIDSEELVNTLASISASDHSYRSAKDTFQKVQANLNLRDNYYTELVKLRDHFLLSAIYNIVQNSILLSSANKSYINIDTPNDKELGGELTDMFDKLSIESLLLSILPDILHYGGYSLKVKSEEGVGIVELLDIYESKDVIPLVDSVNNPLVYFVKSEGLVTANRKYSKLQSTLALVPISQILHFSATNEYIKLSVADNERGALNNITAKFDFTDESLEGTISELLASSKIKAAKSFILPVKDLLKSLELLKKIKALKSTASILKPEILAVTVPDMTDVDESIKIVDQYSNLINSNLAKVTRDDLINDQVSLQDVASVKIIPVTSSGRADMRSVDTSSSQDQQVFSNETVKEEIELILSILGIPIELFNGEVSGREAMKTFIRFAKIVKTAQKALSRSLQNMCLLHLSYKYPDKEFNEADIKISLTNSNNYDAVEDLEPLDLIISSIDNILGLTSRLEEEVLEGSGYKIDKSALAEAVKSSLGSIGSAYESILVKGDSPKVEEEVEESKSEADEGTSAILASIKSKQDTVEKEVEEFDFEEPITEDDSIIKDNNQGDTIL